MTNRRLATITATVTAIVLAILFAIVVAVDVCKDADPCSWWTYLFNHDCYSCPDASGGGGSGAS